MKKFKLMTGKKTNKKKPSNATSIEIREEDKPSFSEFMAMLRDIEADPDIPDKEECLYVLFLMEFNSISYIAKNIRKKGVLISVDDQNVVFQLALGMILNLHREGLLKPKLIDALKNGIE